MVERPPVVFPGSANGDRGISCVELGERQPLGEIKWHDRTIGSDQRRRVVGECFGTKYATLARRCGFELLALPKEGERIKCRIDGDDHVQERTLVLRATNGISLVHARHGRYLAKSLHGQA